MTRSKELVSYSWKPLSPEASTFPPPPTHTHNVLREHWEPSAHSRTNKPFRRNGNEDIIAQAVRDEVTKSTENAPNLPEGNDLVTIDEHLSDELITDIVNDKYIDLSKVSSVESVRGEEEYQLVYDKQGNKVYKPIKKSKEIDNFFKYLRNMFILGACYLRHKPEVGPQFLQYLFNILEENKHFKFKPVMVYDESFRMHRERNPAFSWAKVHEIHHTKLNKYHNIRPTPGREGMIQTGGPHTSFHNTAPSTGDNEIQELCKQFNRWVCTGPCKFSHVCWYCFKREHPGHKCWNRPQSKC